MIIFRKVMGVNDCHFVQFGVSGDLIRLRNRSKFVTRSLFAKSIC